MNPLAEALERIRDAYPDSPFGDRAIRVYAEQLADLDGDAVLAATRALLNTSRYIPRISEIRRTVAEDALRLPTVEEAWDMALDGNSQGIEPVSLAMKAVGGPWSIRNTAKPETLRAQFRRDYEGRRETFIRKAAEGRPITGEQLKRIGQTNATVDSLNGHRLKQLEASTRIHPRPVMWRLGQRMAGRVIPPPDEAMMQDAIRILRDDRDGDEDVLYAEAERVLHDANEG